MIKLFDAEVPANWVLLEYSEGKDVKDFDLSLPLNESVLTEIVAKKYPHLLNLCTAISKKDRGSGLMIDSFLDPKDDPAIVTFSQRETLLNEFNLSAKILENKEYFATVVYVGRDKEVRVIYRDSEQRDSKTNVYDKEGNYLYDEFLFEGTLPAELSWANDIQEKLREHGIKCRINHFKLNQGYPAKVYFYVKP